MRISRWLALSLMAAGTAWGAEFVVDGTSISQVLTQVKPGDTVLVKNGTYREQVTVPEGKPDAPISLLAFPGHRPVIKGSDAVSGPWKAESKRGVYTCTFEPYTQMVFVDEEPLKQIGEFEYREPNYAKITFDGKGPDDLRPGTFYYDKNAHRLFVWLCDSSDPGKHRIEAAVRYRGISADGYTHIVGFDVRHCQAGAGNKGHAGILGGGRCVVIENCQSTHNDFSGMIVAGEDCVVRNCELAYNGNDGFTSNRGYRMLLDGVTTHHNNTRNYDVGWHAGGLKIVMWDQCKIIRHHAYDEWTGLWFDINCRNMLIADCLIEKCHLGIYYEISRWGIIVNNVVRDCFRGIWSYSSDVLIAHNVVDRCAEGITVTGAPRFGNYVIDPSKPWHNCLVAVRNNMILDNVIIDAVQSYIGIEKDSPHNGPHYCDYNMFVWTLPVFTPTGNHIKFMSSWDNYYGRLALWEQAGYDRHGMISDPAMYDLLRSLPAPYPYYVDVNRVLPDPKFVNRSQGDYHLAPDSPLRKRGCQVPPELSSVYVSGQHPWEKTLVEDAPDPKKAQPVLEVGGKHYRVQPEPRPGMMFDPSKMPSADPGINWAWSQSGRYPSFREEKK